MFKLVLEKGEEPEIKLPTSTRSLKKQTGKPEKGMEQLSMSHDVLYIEVK